MTNIILCDILFVPKAVMLCHGGQIYGGLWTKCIFTPHKLGSGTIPLFFYGNFFKTFIPEFISPVFIIFLQMLFAIKSDACIIMLSFEFCEYIFMVNSLNKIGILVVIINNSLN